MSTGLSSAASDGRPDDSDTTAASMTVRKAPIMSAWTQINRPTIWQNENFFRVATKKKGGENPASGLIRQGSLSAKAHARGAFRKLFVKAALIELGDRLTFKLVAFVQERQAEGVTNILENPGVFGPCQHRPR